MTRRQQTLWDLTWALIGAVAIVVLLAAVCGCTIAPKPVTASAPSMDGNVANSGLVGRLADGSYEITANALARYNGLIRDGYGERYVPALKSGAGVSPLPNGDFRIDAQHLAYFAEMATAHRSGIKP